MQVERGEWREGDHHTQRSSSFFVDQLLSHTWLPRRGLSSSLMCSLRPLLPVLLPLLPRRPGQHLPDGAPPRRTASSTSATASQPAAPPPRRLGRCSQRSCRQLLPDAAALSSMQGPPRSGNFSAQTSASLHPSRSASLAGPLPFTRGMGAHGLCGRVPDSAGNACSLNCRCSGRRKSLGPSAPIAYATSVSPPNEAAAWPCARVLGAG